LLQVAAKKLERQNENNSRNKTRNFQPSGSAIPTATAEDARQRANYFTLLEQSSLK